MFLDAQGDKLEENAFSGQPKCDEAGGEWQVILWTKITAH